MLAENDAGQPDLIHIIEDDTALLFLIQKLLNRAGYQTRGFTDGTQAVSVIPEDPPRLLLLDYQLTGMTATTIIDTLSEQQCLPPFIIMTGHGNESIAVEMMKLGALDYIIKDGSFLDLLSSIIGKAMQHLIMEQKYLEAEAQTRQLEAQLAQSRKMEAIGTLAGGIAHDFNNILSAILGYAELVNDDLHGESVAKMNIREVLKAAIRARDLVRRILTFSRMSEPVHTSVNLNVLVKEAMDLLRASIPSTIRMAFKADGSDMYIHGNPTQIHQVIVNLCTNAAQAVKDLPGEITVSLLPVTIPGGSVFQGAALPAGNYVELCVGDSGEGIAPGDIDRIFDPYFTTRDVGQGSGMGLAIVHGIVNNHHGFIDVKSTPGSGTMFRLLFPETPPGDIIEPIDAVCLPTGRECVLVVDDEKAVADLNRLRLERMDYQVTAVTDSLAALELFKKQPAMFDLVITDQTMPGMTGLQLARHMLSIRPDLPVILCTGYDPDVNQQEIASAGIRECIMKPFSREVLARTIMAALGKGSDGNPLPA